MLYFFVSDAAKELVKGIENNPDEFYTIRESKKGIEFGGKYVMTGTIETGKMNMLDRYYVKKALYSVVKKMDNSR